MRKWTLSLVIGLALSSPAYAQITPTYTFSNGQVADADQVNANFALLGSALNRTGGTMTGTLTTRNVVPDGNNTRDLGASGTRWANVYATTYTGSGTGLTDVALLAAANAFTGASNTALRQTYTNSTSGTAALAGWQAVAGTTTLLVDALSQGFTTSGPAVQAGGQILSNGAGGLSLGGTHASGALRFYTNSVQQWGVNAAGDFTQGTSSAISDSTGTPTVTGGTGGSCNVAGKDYAFVITVAAGAPTACAFSFGHTWTNTPICAFGSRASGQDPYFSLGPTSSTFSIAADFTASPVMVLCRYAA
jgi:hypothetical protein